MLLQVLLGCALIAATISIHASFMVLALEWTRRSQEALNRRPAAWITGLVVWFFLAMVAEAWAWALAYLALGIFANLETALYFSTVTFTTLGYGDITLDQEWRLLGSFEAVNGNIILGWTTAMVFFAVQRSYHIEVAGDGADRPRDREA